MVAAHVDPCYMNFDTYTIQAMYHSLLVDENIPTINVFVYGQHWLPFTIFLEDAFVMSTKFDAVL